MKINSIDIAAFGKFKDFHLDLSDGMTVILGENEKGKTTLMSFIRMMFYGHSGKVSDAERNPRVKYRPWNTDFMAGSITFTHGGTSYRLERQFKKTNSADKITLINLDLNKAQPLSGSDDIGAKFFGLTDAAFERSVFIGELNAPLKNEAANGEINAKLSNIAVTGDEDINFDAVKSRLQKAKEVLLSKGGKKGKYDKALLRYAELEREIEAAKEKEETAAQLQRKAKEKEDEIRAASAETARLFELLKNTDKIKKRIFLQRYIDAQKELSALSHKLALKDGGTADKKYISLSEELYGNATVALERLKAIEAQVALTEADIRRLESSVSAMENAHCDNMTSALTAQRDALDSKIDRLREQSLKLHTDIEALTPVKKINPLFFAVGAVLAAVGVIFAGIQFYAAVALIIAGIATAICGIIFKRSIMPDGQELRQQLTENSQDLAVLLDQKQTILERIAAQEKGINDRRIKIATQKALLEGKKQEYAEKRTAQSSAAEAYKQAEEALFAHLGRLAAIEDMSCAQRLIAETAEIMHSADLISQKLSVLADQANCSSLAEAEEKLAICSDDTATVNMTEDEVDIIKEKFKAQSDITGKMRSELTALKAEVKAVCDACSSTSVLIRQQEELARQIDGYKTFCENADTALVTLEDAFREMRKSYSGALDSRTAEIFSLLSSEKYKSVNVSNSFELNVTTDEAFGIKSASYLSEGTENQLYLALRLAIAELITAQDEPLPLFMDDPLSNFDDGRACRAVDFLKDYAQNKQIVMFTCHNSFADMAKEQNINIIEF